MKTSEILSDFERFAKKYPSAALVLKADIEDDYYPVLLETIPVSQPPTVVFSTNDIKKLPSLSTFQTALETVPPETPVCVMHNKIRYNVVGVAAHNKQFVILLTQKAQ